MQNNRNSIQRGGDIWACTLADKVEFKNIDDAIKHISGASQNKILKLIISTYGQKIGWLKKTFYSGFRCLEKYLEAYYTMLQNLSIPPQIKIIDFQKLGKLNTLARIRVLYALVYLYLKKNLLLTEDTKSEFNKGIITTLTQYKKQLAKSLPSNKVKQNKIDALNTFNQTIVNLIYDLLIPSHQRPATKDVPNLIITLNNILRSIKAEQVTLESQELSSITTVARRIRNEEQKKAGLQATLTQETVSGLSTDQITEKLQQIGELLYKVAGNFKTLPDTNLEKVDLQALLVKHNTEYDRLVKKTASNIVNDNTEKVALQNLFNDSTALDSYVSSQLAPNTGTLYSIDNEQLEKENASQLISSINAMKSSEVSGQFDKVIISLKTIIKAADANNTISKINPEIRYAILTSMFRESKITQNSNIALNLMTTLLPRDLQNLAKYSRTPTIVSDIYGQLDINAIDLPALTQYITSNITTIDINIAKSLATLFKSVHTGDSIGQFIKKLVNNVSSNSDYHITPNKHPLLFLTTLIEQMTTDFNEIVCIEIVKQLSNDVSAEAIVKLGEAFADILGKYIFKLINTNANGQILGTFMNNFITVNHANSTVVFTKLLKHINTTYLEHINSIFDSVSANTHDFTFGNIDIAKEFNKLLLFAGDAQAAMFIRKYVIFANASIDNFNALIDGVNNNTKALNIITALSVNATIINKLITLVHGNSNKLKTLFDTANDTAEAGLITAIVEHGTDNAKTITVFNALIDGVNDVFKAVAIIISLTSNQIPQQLTTLYTAAGQQQNAMRDALINLMFAAAENDAQKAFIKYAAVAAILRTEATSNATADAPNDSMAAKIQALGVDHAVVVTYTQANDAQQTKDLPTSANAFAQYTVVATNGAAGGVDNITHGVAVATDVAKLVNAIKFAVAKDVGANEPVNGKSAYKLFIALYDNVQASTNNAVLPTLHNSGLTFDNMQQIQNFITNIANDANGHQMSHDIIHRIAHADGTPSIQLGGSAKCLTKKHNISNNKRNNDNKKSKLFTKKTKKNNNKMNTSKKRKY